MSCAILAKTRVEGVTDIFGSGEELKNLGGGEGKVPFERKLNFFIFAQWNPHPQMLIQNKMPVHMDFFSIFLRKYQFFQRKLTERIELDA